MSLDANTKQAIETGRFIRLDLVRFDLPGKTVGYHRGGRPFTYQGLEYLPNRFLTLGDQLGGLGTYVTTRTIGFSNVPTPNTDDAIAALEQYDYVNAPVIISTLVGAAGADEPIGILMSNIYEIDSVRYLEGAMQRGKRSLTVEIDLQPPGRSAVGTTGVKRSPAEQQFDNDATDTGFEYVASVSREVVRWGQQSQ